ncbi:MAG: hydrogen cyanide synthase HcnC [Paracoccaceae bacterium]|jgi:hydrogen cyanide synthase HcnC
MSKATDIAVVGGGLVGASLAWGFQQSGASVTLIDAGEDRFHASAGNFGLVWVQGKGADCVEYADLSQRSAKAWQQFAEALEDRDGQTVPLGYRACGGVKIALGEAELRTMAAALERMHAQAGPVGNGTVLLDERALCDMIPAVGPEASGGTFCPHDGHADPLATLHALHRALRRAGVQVVQGKALRVSAEAPNQGFDIKTDAGRVTCGRVVLAAGLGTPGLCEPLGLRAMLRPQRGQIVVTERTDRFLDPVCHTVRQTEDGTVMLGDSKEEAGFDTATTPLVTRTILNRAVRCFPHLAQVRLMRTWGALRVMSPDGLPIYQTSTRYPGASLVTCHSGVTLAAAHSGEVAAAILEDRMNETYPAFSTDRFGVTA